MNLEKTLLAQMADIAIVVDGKGLNSYVSPSVAKFGLDPAAMIGQSNIDLIHPDDRPKVRQLVRDLLAGRLDQKADREYRVMLPGGRQIWIEGQPTLLFDNNGEAIGYLTILRDVTNRREALSQAADDAARRLLNHDIRTPLNGILAASQILQASAPSQDLSSLVADIAASAEALRRTLEPFLASEPTPLETRPAAPDQDWSTVQGRRLRVLAADDHLINLHMIEAILDPVADVAMVENGAEALEAFVSGEFDVVLLDVQMPIMDGLTTVREIRKLDPPRRTTPVIMVTANARPEDERASLDAGADLHMTKPIQPHRLIRAVLEHSRP